MTDQATILDWLLARHRRGLGAALALVAATQGSTPAPAGALLAVSATGERLGTIGGGALEHQVTQDLQGLRQAQVRHLELTPEGAGLLCGGGLTLLLVRLDDPAAAVLGEALARLEQGQGCSLTVRVEESGVVHWGLDAPGDPGADLAIPLVPAPDLLVFGAGHIAQALAPMALSAGFRVGLWDERDGLLDGLAVPAGLRLGRLPSFGQVLDRVRIGASSSVLICTHGHRHDRLVLEQILGTPAGYIGMVGSRRKRAELFAQLETAGWAAEALARVHCPVGLAIGARTPAEIAISILAQLIAVRRG